MQEVESVHGEHEVVGAVESNGCPQPQEYPLFFLQDPPDFPGTSQE